MVKDLQLLRTDTTDGMAVGISNVYQPDSTSLTGSFIWLQTWGPCTPIYKSNAGNTGPDMIFERSLYYTGLGKVETSDSSGVGFTVYYHGSGTSDSTSHINNAQNVGYYLGNITAGNDFTARSPMYLTITP